MSQAVSSEKNVDSVSSVTGKESHHKQENNIISEITKYFKQWPYIIITMRRVTQSVARIKDRSTIYSKAVARRKVGNSTDIIGHLIGQEVPARARYQVPDPRDLVTRARGFVEDSRRPQQSVKALAKENYKEGETISGTERI